jgi:hypothetical protein
MLSQPSSGCRLSGAAGRGADSADSVGDLSPAITRLRRPGRLQFIRPTRPSKYYRGVDAPAVPEPVRVVRIGRAGGDGHGPSRGHRAHRGICRRGHSGQRQWLRGRSPLGRRRHGRNASPVCWRTPTSVDGWVRPAAKWRGATAGTNILRLTEQVYERALASRSQRGERTHSA